jgi:hypothetical protein
MYTTYIYNKDHFYSQYKLNWNKKLWDYLKNNFKYFDFPISDNAYIITTTNEKWEIIWLMYLLKNTFYDSVKLYMSNNDIKKYDSFLKNDIDILNISFISVHPDFQWKWISKILIDYFMNLKQNEITKFCVISYFTEMWKERLRKNIIEYWNKYNIQIFSTEEWFLN